MNAQEPTDFGSLFNDLASTDEQIAREQTRPDNRQKFPCGQCAGTGIYQGARVHQEKSHCFACRGKGYFLTDPRKLKARKVAKAQNAEDKKRAAIQSYKETHPEMYENLRQAYYDHQGGNPFIISLATQLFTKGNLTENQIAAWQRGNEKLKVMQAEREAQRKQSAVEVDLTPIRAMFETAVGNGYKKPTYRAEGLVISRAPDHGNNPGALYIKTEHDTYLGKILGTTFHPNRDGREAGPLLLEIAKDPLAAALRYGQRTGRCACCGRLLTNHTSIDLGIGPICKERWGL